MSSNLNSGKTITFLHIPKTGGVSLNEIAKKQYKKNEIVEFRAGKSFFEFKQKKENIKFIQGHLAYGFHEIHSIDTTYITMLRNPIDRVISNYYFILQNEKHFLNAELKDYTLKEYVESGIALNTENCQVRYLTNNVDLPHNSCTIEMLELAKQNLLSSFSAFGVQEYYDEFLILLMEIHSWKIPFYRKYNVTKKRKSIDSLDSETLSTIKKYNQLDIELYQFAKTEMEKLMLEKGVGFQKKLNKFRFQNSIYQKLSKIKNKILPS